MLRETRAAFLSWFGIIGSAITLTGHWGAFLQLGAWFRFVLDEYVALLHRFWRGVLWIFDIEISEPHALFLSLIVFAASFTVGAYLESGGRKGNYIRDFALFAALSFFYLFLMYTVVSERTPLSLAQEQVRIGFAILSGLFLILLYVLIFRMTEGRLIHRVFYALVYESFAVLVFFTFGKALRTFNPLFQMIDIGNDMFTIGVVSVFMSCVFLLLVAPLILVQPRAVTKRALFILIGIAMIWAVATVSGTIAPEPNARAAAGYAVRA